MSAHLAVRTRFFDRVLVRALDAGVRQVVIAAAGYDGRALRYVRQGVRWIELDHPDTQRDKLERIRALGIRAGHIRFVPADFTRDDVAAGLLAAGCDPAVPEPGARGGHRRLPGAGGPRAPAPRSPGGGRPR